MLIRKVLIPLSGRYDPEDPEETATMVSSFLESAGYLEEEEALDNDARFPVSVLFLLSILPPLL